MPNDDKNWQENYLDTFHKTYVSFKRAKGWTNEFIAEEIGVGKDTTEKWSKGISAAQGGT